MVDLLIGPVTDFMMFPFLAWSWLTSTQELFYRLYVLENVLFVYLRIRKKKTYFIYIFSFFLLILITLFIFFLLGKNFRTFLRVIKYNEDKHSRNILVKYMTIDVFIAQKFLWQLYFEASCLKGQGMSFCSGLSYL